MTQKEIKEKSPQGLNAYVYALVGCENQHRAWENRMGAGSLDKEDDAHIPNVDYYEALEICKSQDTETHLRIEAAVRHAQAAFQEVMDREVGKELAQLIAGL